MRVFLTYWFVGCILIAAAVNFYTKNCTTYERPTPSVQVALVAVWPAIAIEFLFRPESERDLCR